MRPFHGVRSGSRLARRASRARADQSGWATLFHPFAPAQSARAAKESARRLHYAERHSVDLITMPTHGYGPFRAALLGSVTAKVIHDTRCPVWTSVHAEKIHNPPYPYRLILCAIDDLEMSVSVIRKAGEMAAAFESALVLVHATSPSEKRTESEIRSGLEQRGWSGEVSVPILIETGHIVSVVTQMAARQGADLVIVGRGHSAAAFGSLRSHVYGIIRESPCPVLTV